MLVKVSKPGAWAVSAAKPESGAFREIWDLYSTLQDQGSLERRKCQVSFSQHRGASIQRQAMAFESLYQAMDDRYSSGPEHQESIESGIAFIECRKHRFCIAVLHFQGLFQDLVCLPATAFWTAQYDGWAAGGRVGGETPNAFWHAALLSTRYTCSERECERFS